MIFKCKICGGDLNIERGQSIVECEYCGVKQTLPKFLNENTKLMYDRANSYLMHNEFDKAENIYNQILFSDKEDADAYWSLVLCKYGISYVKDPKTGRYVPTCNRTYYSSIFDDENYKNAIKYANEEKAELFKTDAKTIEDIQHGIIAISKKEKPFDIFISYKETYMNGTRTRDSIAAQDLYDKLTSEGYKVFFSRITLEDKAGTEYEPYIYAALASSKVMITVCSSRENIESVWVKNEWSRFLSFAQRDNSKTILPLYFDMDKSELPDEFAHLPSYDMKTEGFGQDLIRGIKKLIPLPIMEKERREKRRKILKKIGIGAAAVCVIAAACAVPWFMKLPDYNAAMQLYYDKNYPEATWAFEDLGSYRDSEEMKDKCEKSWRNSLATIVSGVGNVTPNGTIDFSATRSETQDITITEHGKIVSIGDDSMYYPAVPYVLYEDGYVMNSAKNNRLENDMDWQDIIQISDIFTTTNVALRADGTMLYGNLSYTQDTGYTINDEWLKPISEWKNVIAFDTYMSKAMSGGLRDAAIVGIQNTGDLCGVIYLDEMEYNGYKAKNITEEFEDSLKLFSDVNQIDIQCNIGTPYYNIVALTNHGTVQRYIDGVFEEYDAPNVVSVMLDVFQVMSCDSYIDLESQNIYELHTSGNVYRYDNDKYLLSDVVYLNNTVAVTRSGSIYSFSSGEYGLGAFQDTGNKTKIHNEWLERMK